MSALILTIDQGTTSTRAILFDAQGEIHAVAQQELKLHYPQNGWVEQDPEDIWRDTVAVCRAVLQQAKAPVIAIGITNQRETVVVWDKKTGKPVYNAIVWQDRRTADFCKSLRDGGCEGAITAKTGLLLDPYFSASKARWILDHIRHSGEGLALGTIDSFLLWRLTGGKVHATDITNASRTMLYNIITQDWDDALLGLFKIPRSMLPEVKNNSGPFGVTDKNILDAEIPITGMAGDQQAGLFGQACFAPGMVKSTYGTGCFALMNIGGTFRASKNKMLTTVAWRLSGKISYAIEGSIFVAGAAIQWLRDGLGIIKSASESEAMAQSVPDTGGVYMVPAFTGLGAPYWNPHARGLISGITRATTAAHVVRAGLEAQAYQTQDLMQAMADDAGHAISEIRVDGGMVRNDWLCQFLSDITRVPILRPKVTEATALGAAYLAGLGAGIFSSPDDIAAQWVCERRFKLKMDQTQRNGLMDGWQRAVKSALVSAQ